MTTDETIQALADVIARQHRLGHTLLETLEKEREAVMAMDTDGIDTAGTAKLEQLGEMEALEQERQTLMDLNGLDIQTFTDVDPHGHLDTAWQALMATIKQCRLLNESNGAIVAMQRQHVQQALTVLYGGAVDTNVYGPDGMTLNGGRTTTIATA